MPIRGLLGMSLGLILGLGVASLSSILNPPQYGIEYGYFDSRWPGLLAIMMITFYTIEAHATHHASLFKRGIYIKHGIVGTIRVILAFGLCSLVNAFAFDWTKVLLLTTYCMCWFGITFNYMLNKKRHLPAFYLGKGKRSSLIDKIFARMKYGGEKLMVVQLLIMIITGILYTYESS